MKQRGHENMLATGCDHHTVMVSHQQDALSGAKWLGGRMCNPVLSAQNVLYQVKERLR